MDKMKWSFAQIWNESLEEGRPERPLEPRERIWASELGGSFIDRYLKMTAVKPSNPFNARSLRKFEAGNIWEAIIGYVLKRAGILIDNQEWLKFQYPGLLPTVGKLDFFAGGKPDYQKSISILQKEFDWLPPFIAKATKAIVERLSKEHPEGLSKIVLEIKSCSSFMYEKYERMGTADIKHKLQNFHYLKAKNEGEGHIVYISKDDARLLEIGITNPSPLEDVYKADIEQMTKYLSAKERPPLEKPILFDEVDGSFTSNYKIAYSPYLTFLYGIKDQKEVDDKYKPMVERWNRVLGRICEGKEMTKNNLEAIEEMKKEGFDIERIKPFLKKEVCDEATQKG